MTSRPSGSSESCVCLDHRTRPGRRTRPDRRTRSGRPERSGLYVEQKVKKTKYVNVKAGFCCLYLLYAAIALAATPVTYIFGDSLTNVGNNNFLQYSLSQI